MASIYYGPNRTALNFPNNEMLADIQSLAHARFAAGLGFFMTMAGLNDDGEETSIAYWLHPSIPLVFDYDVVDQYGNYVQPVEVDQNKQARMLSHVEEPLGVIAGFSPNGPFLPFKPIDN
jgi:hypothetical protein